MKNVWTSLFRSRKFWMALIGVIGGIVMYVQGVITAEQLTELILVLVTAVIAGIAAEDAAEKFGAYARPDEAQTQTINVDNTER